jgi:hypothetical protein
MDGIKKLSLHIVVLIAFGILLIIGGAFARAQTLVDLGTVKTDSSGLTTLQTYQEEVKAIDGYYEQILRNGDYEVNVYESPRGKGYQVVFYYDNNIEYFGYGPDAEIYTKSVDITLSDSLIPSSTPIKSN